MRKTLATLSFAALLALPVACVTINVYFPAAAAEAAAEQFVGKVIGGPDTAPADDSASKPPPGKSPGAMLLDFFVPSAYAQQPNINIRTPQVQAIQARMKQRFDSSLSGYLASGAIGLTHDGLVAVHDASAVSLSDRAALNPLVADENRDRNAVYREIAVANNHPEWESQIRETFAKQWVAQAHPGWYYQDASGAWHKK